MTWQAEITPSRPFTAPSSAEVSIDGDALTVRPGGAAAQRFELGSSSDVEVTRHQWHMDDGTAVKIRSGNDGVSIGGRGAFFPDLPYERAVVDRPELVMAGPAFEELHAALVRALAEGSPAVPGSAAHRFLLWKIGDDVRTNALVSCGVIVIGGASTQLPVPFVIHVAMALFLIAGAGWLIARSERAAKLPALALTIDRDLVTVDRLRPAMSTLVAGRSLREASNTATGCRAADGRRAHHSTTRWSDFPSVLARDDGCRSDRRVPGQARADFGGGAPTT